MPPPTQSNKAYKNHAEIMQDFRDFRNFLGKKADFTFLTGNA